MAFKKSLLSKLFNSGSASQGDEEEVEQAEKLSLPPEPDRRMPTTLDLPSKHAIHQLRTLWTDRTGKRPRVEFCFVQPPDGEDVMTKNEEKLELINLKNVVTATATKRLEAVKAIPEGSEAAEADLDAQAEVFLTKDRMSAWIFAYPPTGSGREIDQEMLRQALAAREVSFGLDEELLKSLPNSKNRYFSLFLAARGIRPVHGTDGYVEDLFSRSAHREMVSDEFGQVDYAASNWIQNVKKGETICRIFPPVDGTPGRTVLDAELAPQPGKPAKVPQGRNTMLTEAGDELVAVQSGQIEFNGYNFQVKPVFYVDGNVDFNTGNVDFWGDVHISGNVCSGFTVRATGMITVDGVVEACRIEAGTDLVVTKGVQGNKQALLRAHRSIYAKYLENCSAYAREDLRADCILNCNVYTNGSVLANSGRGIIVGGRVKAAQDVKARSVGSRSEVATMISLGGMPYEDFEYASLRREVVELEERLKQLILQPDSQVKSAQIAKLNVKLISGRNKLKSYKEEMALLKEEAKKEQEQAQEQAQEEEQESGRLICDTAYPGTVIMFGETTLRLLETVSGCVASFVDGEIRLR